MPNSSIIQYVLKNCTANEVINGFSKKWFAHITLCGYDFSEEGKSEKEAKNKLAYSLAESKFIEANFKG
jgi:hypothetical protein